MRKYLITRLALLVPTLLGVSILVFLLIRLLPGTAVDQLLGAEAGATEETIEALEELFGLDQPMYVQYAKWMGKLLQGDLGNSVFTGLPVHQMIFSRLKVTLQLTVQAMLVALVVGVPFGIISAIRENTILDHFVRVISLFSLAVPIFWQAAMMILILSLWFKWSPPVGYVDPLTDLPANFRIMFLPSIVLGTVVAANIMRMTRSSVLDVMRQDYIVVSRAKGLRERMVIWHHALKNALIPVVTVVGLQVGYLLGGTVVAEEVFTLPGVGRLLLWSISKRDYPVMQGTILFIALMFVMTNLVVDLLYSYLDPRVSYD